MSSQGFEVDLSYTFRSLLLKAGYSYTDAHIGKLHPTTIWKRTATEEINIHTSLKTNSSSQPTIHS